MILAFGSARNAQHVFLLIALAPPWAKCLDRGRIGVLRLLTRIFETQEERSDVSVSLTGLSDEALDAPTKRHALSCMFLPVVDTHNAPVSDEALDAPTMRYSFPTMGCKYNAAISDEALDAAPGRDGYPSLSLCTTTVADTHSSTFDEASLSDEVLDPATGRQAQGCACVNICN